MSVKVFRVAFKNCILVYLIQIAVCEFLRIDPELQGEFDLNSHKHESNPRQQYDPNKPTETDYQQNDPRYLIDTLGCSIPEYNLTVKDSYKPWKCGERLVHVKRNDVKTVAFSYAMPFIECCYSFIKIDNNVTRQTRCKHFSDKTQIKLEYDFIYVNCSLEDSENYEDYYSFVAHQKLPKKVTSGKIPKGEHEDISYNVLLLGVDTMSRKRAYDSLADTVRHLLKNKWIDLKGHHKCNSVNNLIPLLTGMNREQYYKADCTENKEQCNNMLIWNRFKNAGYVTASGEDSHHLRSVFNTSEGPWIRPTHHYITPFFNISETHTEDSICTGRKQSGLELLDYILDFSRTYRNHNFFQFFWIRSFGHDPAHSPKPADKHLKNFFVNLESLGVLDNTIVLFFSDHELKKSYATSIDSKKQQLPYDYSLPMLFMWLPKSFKKIFHQEYANLKINRKRLSSAYDVYMTLKDIVKLHDSSIHVPGAKGCATSTSLFQKISDHRTCDEACIEGDICACYNWDENSDHKHRFKRLIRVHVPRDMPLRKNKTTTSPIAIMIRRRRRPYGSHTFKEKINNFQKFINQKRLESTTESEERRKRRMFKKKLAEFSTPYWFDDR